MLRQNTASGASHVAAAQFSLALVPDANGRLHLDANSVAEALRRGVATRIKHGTHRSVYRLDLPYGQYILKHDRNPRLIGKLRGIARASASRREWRKARELRRRHVATIDAIGFAETRRWGLVQESFLLSRAIPNSSSLAEYLAEQLPRLPKALRLPVRKLLTDRLARLIAQAHQAGVYHNDLHAGNVLVTTPRLMAAIDLKPDRFQLFLIDVPGVRLSWRPGWRSALKNLTMLRAAFERLAGTRDYIRFWRVYSRNCQEIAVPPLSITIRQIEPRAAAYLRRLHSSRDKRSLAENRDFHRFHSPLGRGHVVAGLDAHAIVQALSALSCATEKTDQTASSGPLMIPGHTRPLRYYRDRPPTWRGWLRRVMRGSRSRDLWCLGHALASRQIAIPLPLLVVESNSWGGRGNSYLVSQWLTDAVNVTEYAGKLQGLPNRQRAVRSGQCSEALGELLGLAHRWRFALGKLNAAQLAVIEEPGGVRAYLIDYSHARRRRRLGRAESARELAHLAESLAGLDSIGRGVQLRFLRAYLKQAHIPVHAWKWYWRRIGRELARRRTAIR